MIRQLWKLFWFEKELKRQIAHLFFGLLYATGYYFGIISVNIAFGLFAVTVLLSLVLRQNRTFLDEIILILERDKHLFEIPLRGLIFFLLGAAIAIRFFSFEAALGGIVVLSLTDSIGTLYGKYMGQISIPWSRTKHAEGPIIGGLLSTIMLMSYLPLLPALLASYAGALCDTFTIRIFKYEIDDNLLIPIVAAAVIEILI